MRAIPFHPAHKVPIEAENPTSTVLNARSFWRTIKTFIMRGKIFLRPVCFDNSFQESYSFIRNIQELSPPSLPDSREWTTKEPYLKRF